jgi:3-phenylpropionate/trans-cinnamate dioxygenase ferredoxin subunit
MADTVEIAGTGELVPGMMKKVTVRGHEYLLVRDGDRFYCTDNRCPHLDADLSTGFLVGTILTCPLHHSRFDITDGHVIRWTDLSGRILSMARKQKPPRPLRTYRVTVDGGKILVDIP